MDLKNFLKPTFIFCLIVIILCATFIAKTLPNSPYPALVPYVWPIFIIISLFVLIASLIIG